MAIMNITSGHLKNAALRTALEVNVTEILHEAGPQGLHVNDTAKICDVDANKLGRLLRILALDQCYRDASPDVFANTRISSVLDSGKSVAEVLSKPEDKHDETSGLGAFIEHLSGDGGKFSPHRLENLKDPKTGRSDEPIHAPFNRVFNVETPLWIWSSAHAAADILEDMLDWKALPENSVVVDVGGGIGTTSVAVAKNNKHLKFIVQDLKNICEEAKIHWNKEYPEVIDSGRVTFTPHDFFTPQPITNASVFIVKHILHNWGDSYSAKILNAPRVAAMPDTKLIVVDNIIAYACHDPTTDPDSGSGGYKEAPAPLLPNYGATNIMPYLVDLGMMTWLNSTERTIGPLEYLLQSTGWKLDIVKRRDLLRNFYEYVVAVPII